MDELDYTEFYSKSPETSPFHRIIRSEHGLIFEIKCKKCRIIFTVDPKNIPLYCEECDKTREPSKYQFIQSKKIKKVEITRVVVFMCKKCRRLKEAVIPISDWHAPKTCKECQNA